MISLTLIACLIFMTVILWYVKHKDWPPGPYKLPLIGSVPFLTMKHGIVDWHFDKEVVKHKLSTVFLGPTRLHVVNDYTLAKDLFGRDEFSGRNVPDFIREARMFNNKIQGIIHNQGENWTAQRRFSLKTLKDFGFGKQSLEETINKEIDEIIEEFKAYGGQDFEMRQDFNIPIINILWQLIAEDRFTKEKHHEIGLKIIESITEAFSTGLGPAFYPRFINKTFPNFTGYGRRKIIIENQMKFFMSEIERHKDTLDVNSPRDFIDVYLTEMEIGNNKHLDVENLAVNICEMFVAGTETSSTTLKWFIIYMILYDEVQTKCRDEIHSVLGTDRRFDMSMTTMLPYTAATIAEIQRVACVAPMSIMHQTTLPTTVGQYKFPKGSIFLANLSYISNDPTQIRDPLKFDPTRWIGPDGRFVKNERLIPFGIGKRTCMGEILARNEIFLFTVNLIQKLKFSPASYNPPPDLNNFKAGLTRMPDNFYLRVSPV